MGGHGSGGRKPSEWLRAEQWAQGFAPAGEVAEILGVSKYSVYRISRRWRAAGNGRSFETYNPMIVWVHIEGARAVFRARNQLAQAKGG